MSTKSDPGSDGVPKALQAGTPMQKISSKKIKQVVMRITEGSITWAGSGDSKSESHSFHYHITRLSFDFERETMWIS